MHIIAGTQEAETVLLVKVNGKIVTMPVELDTDEGWVDCLVPKFNKTINLGEKEAVELAPSEYERKRLTGTIDILFKV